MSSGVRGRCSTLMGVFVVFCIQINFVTALFPQDWNWQRDDLVLNPSGLDLTDATSWAWGDLDLDGNPDVVVQKRGGTISSHLVAYRSRGSDEPPYWAEAPELLEGLMETPLSQGVTFADLDGDASLNIITKALKDAASDRWRLLYWQRDSTGTWMPDTTVFNGVELSDSYFPDEPFFADIDGDYDFDMIIGGDPSALDARFRFYENVGSARAPVWREDASRLEFVHQNPFGYDAWSPILMRFNEDSLLDLVVAYDIEGYFGVGVYPAISDSQGIRWSGDFIEFFSTLYEGDILKLLPFDINNDSRDDLLVLEGVGTGRAYLMFDSLDDPVNPDYFRLGPLMFQSRSSAILFDYNDDQEMDLLAIGHIATFAGIHTLFQPYEKHTLAGMTLWRNTGWFKEPRSFFDVSGFKGQLSDINNNGRLDFTYALVRWELAYSGFMLFENADTSLSLNWVPKSNLIAPFQDQYSRKDTAYFDPGLADLDADGDMDLLLLERIFVGPDSGKASYRFFENQLTADSIIWKERPDWIAGFGNEIYHQSNFGDLDSDNDQDLVFGTNQGTLVLYQNIGDQSRPSWRKVEIGFDNIDVGSFGSPSFADFDRDGHVDLLAGNLGGELFFYRNTTVVGVSDRSQEGPISLRLFQNYPNPFNPETTIEYKLAKPGNVQLTIYNLLGQHVRTLVDAWQPAGSYRVSWDGKMVASKQAASGVYVYELKVGDSVLRRKMILLR